MALTEVMRDWLWVFFGSAIPLTEQRVAIPLGVIMYDFNPMMVFLISFLGSLLPVPFILLLFNRIFEWLKKYRQFDWFTNFVERKIRKNKGSMEKYKEIGLIIFVAIPLPTTGLWTGSAIAAFMGLDFKKSFFCTALGGAISAFIITAASVAAPEILKTFIH
jgi:uncharacterized membrane protein